MSCAMGEPESWEERTAGGRRGSWGSWSPCPCSTSAPACLDPSVRLLHVVFPSCYGKSRGIQLRLSLLRKMLPSNTFRKKKGGGGEEGAENFFLSALERVNVGLERSKITNALTVSVSVSQLTFLSDPACQGLLQMNTNDLGLHYPIITQILLLIYV